jgi:hypothetical protein
MKVFLYSSILLLLCGCGGGVQSRLDEVQGAYASGEYIAAAENFSGKKEFQDQNDLQLLITADALFQANDFSESDAAYEEFNKRNIDLTGLDMGREAGALLGGNMANSYRPYMMDSLFVSYYQIWSALAEGRVKDARVIINQSYARQQRMSREYQNLIAEAKKAAAENADLTSTLHDENSQWAAFRDIMNPALMYLSGIYFLNSGDFENAKTYLKRSNGMLPDNDFIKADLNAANNGATPSGIAWVFIESGYAPRLHERRINLPWLSGRGIIWITIALSQPVFGTPAPAIDSAKLVADVDGLFMTEYKEYQINEAARAWASAVSKAALQAVAYNSKSQYSGLVGLGTTIYSMASTSAEIRTWATLPKQIRVLRVQKNNDGLIELKSNGNIVSKIQVPKSGNHLVYIRQLNGRLEPKVIKIK